MRSCLTRPRSAESSVKRSRRCVRSVSAPVSAVRVARGFLGLELDAFGSAHPRSTVSSGASVLDIGVESTPSHCSTIDQHIFATRNRRSLTLLSSIDKDDMTRWRCLSFSLSLAGGLTSWLEDDTHLGQFLDLCQFRRSVPLPLLSRSGRGRSFQLSSQPIDSLSHQLPPLPRTWSSSPSHPLQSVP